MSPGVQSKYYVGLTTSFRYLETEVIIFSSVKTVENQHLFKIITRVGLHVQDYPQLNRV
jgi:hypothetical protein